MFILEPQIGSFAPLNRDLLISEGVAIAVESLREADRLGQSVESMRAAGSLERMARAGWNRRRIDGFASIADFLVGRFSADARA